MAGKVGEDGMETGAGGPDTSTKPLQGSLSIFPIPSGQRLRPALKEATGFTKQITWHLANEITPALPTSSEISISPWQLCCLQQSQDSLKRKSTINKTEWLGTAVVGGGVQDGVELQRGSRGEANR